MSTPPLPSFSSLLLFFSTSPLPSLSLNPSAYATARCSAFACQLEGAECFLGAIAIATLEWESDTDRADQ